MTVLHPIGKFVLVVLLIGAILFPMQTFFREGRSIETHMERESPAWLAALNAFKERNGAYPEKLEQLVPDYINSLPACSPDPNGVESISYRRRGGGGYTLTCHTYLFQKRTYDSASGKWFSWEDDPPPELKSP